MSERERALQAPVQSEERPEDRQPAAPYRAPQLIDIGAARDLVQGYDGRNYDSYRGTRTSLI
jgi:hypothetical protein